MRREKRGEVTVRGDAAITGRGGSPEREVALWWNALLPADRVSAAHAAGAMYADEATGEWAELAPIGQQMAIHMFYDGVPLLPMF